MLTLNKKPLEERTDLTLSETRMWRIPMRIKHIDPQTKKIGLIIPDWNKEEIIYFDRDNFSEKIIQATANFQNLPYRFHASANINVEKLEDLYIDFSGQET